VTVKDQHTRWANRLIAVVAVMAVFWYASWWLDRRTEPARWRVDPSAELSATSDTIPIVVNESGCASGRSSEGRIDVDVFYGADTVRLAVGVRPLVDRDQDCPGNPDTPYDVRLSEPLGERTVVGENWPGDEAQGSVEAAPRVWLFPTTGEG
jgi:hypothetical protein